MAGPEDYASRLEREIDLHPASGVQDNDTIEIIVYQQYPDDVFVNVTLVDNNVYRCSLGTVPDTRTTVFEYFADIYYPYYDIGLKNMSTGQWQWTHCYDADDYSSYIEGYKGSAELYKDSFTYEFYNYARFEDEWTHTTGGSTYRPAVTFDYSFTDPDDPYVDVDYWWDNSRSITPLETFYPDGSK